VSETPPATRDKAALRREYARLVSQLCSPQHEVADRLGLSRETLNRRLNGKHGRIIAENILAIRQLLHEDLQSIL
jgi:transcriptional regulator with XRE-family HTH domain